MFNRRKFIRQSLLSAGAVMASNSLLAFANEENALQQLTILHTNDVHSRLEPFAMDGSKNQGLGGVAARAALIESIRNSSKETLLLDAGDIFQGTPFFNMYKGELEMKAMKMMGYEAITIGNHDFDLGMDNFVTQWQHAKFPVLNCNYGLSNTPLENIIEPYKIFKKGKLKIGVTGVGIHLDGLVPANLFGNTQYLDPIQNVNNIAYKLKKEEQCDLVICLSHLGYSYKEDSNKMCDIILAKESENIDLIIGGHTHTFLDKPDVYKNKIGKEVLVNQVGWAGIMLGRLDYEFSKSGHKNNKQTDAILIKGK
jgi:5'-nucleotidase